MPNPARVDEFGSIAALTVLDTDLGIVGLIGAPVGFCLLIDAGCGRCPRCGNYFTRRGAYHYEGTRACLNCGIKIDTPMTRSTIA